MNNLRTKITTIINLAIFAFLLAALISVYLITVQNKDDLLKTKKEVMSVGDYDLFLLRQSLQKLQPKIDQVNNYFIDKDSAVLFLEKIEELARESGLVVNIQNVDLVQKTRDKKIYLEDEVEIEKINSHGELSMTVQVSGTWSGIMTFLATIEGLDKKVIVKGVRISAVTDSETGSSSWSAIFELYGYTT